MTSEWDAALDAVLIGGREPVRIQVVSYDADWPRRFAAQRDVIAAALGDRALTIEHIGSTSVEGLAAKPIIDVLVTVPNVEDEASYVPMMEAAGFVLRVREPDHRMFRTPDRDVHVHVHEPGNAAVSDYLDFRDLLRISAEDREVYGMTKRRLAEREWEDMNHYADAKTDVISRILDRAQSWRGRDRPAR